MRVIMFQDRFAFKVRDGTKRHTIRKAARCKSGDMLSLRRWTGRPYRSKQEVLRTQTCMSVEPVRITRDGVRINGLRVDADQIARDDGFVDFGEMVLWFGITHGLPFDGFLIRWVNEKADRPAKAGERLRS